MMWSLPLDTISEGIALLAFLSMKNSDVIPVSHLSGWKNYTYSGKVFEMAF